MSKKRINLNLNTDLVDTLDAFAEMNSRTRTFVVEELLMPSLPMLKELLKLAKDISAMSDSDRLIALQKMKNTEDDLQEIMNQLPGQVREVAE